MNIINTVLCASCALSYASQAMQGDWSGGPSGSGFVTEWTDRFESAETVAWLSIPGRLQLSSVPLDVPVEHLVFSGTAKPYSADIGDINCDGLNDIAMGAYEAGVVHVYCGAPDGTWTRTVTMTLWLATATVTAFSG